MVNLVNHHNYLKIIIYLFLFNFEYLVSGQLLNWIFFSSIIINDKLYFFGGETSLDPKVHILSNMVAYIDLSLPFSRNQPLPIKQIALKSALPKFVKVALVLGGANNETLYLIAGGRIDLPYGSIVYSTNTFDTWTPEILDGQLELAKVGPTLYTKDNNGNTYIITSYINDPRIYKFNANSLAFTTLTPSNVGPPIRIDFFNCLLMNDETIVCFGGDTEDYITIVYLYSILQNSWSIMKTAGDIPSKRKDPTSVLAPDGRIIVYGGTFKSDKLIILDTTQNPFQWTIPTNIVHPIIEGQHYGHTSHLYNNYMIISFGWIWINKNQPYQNILLLDISDKNNYKWLDTFVPNQTKPPTTSTSPSTSTNQTTQITASTDSSTTISIDNQPISQYENKNNNVAITLGSVIAGIVFIILIVAGLVLYRRKRKSSRLFSNDEKEINIEIISPINVSSDSNTEVVFDNNSINRLSDSNIEIILSKNVKGTVNIK